MLKSNTSDVYSQKNLKIKFDLDNGSPSEKH